MKMNVVDMVRVTEKMIAETFSVDRTYLYLVDNEKKQIMRYTDTGDTKVFPIDAGLIGMAVRQRELLSIVDGYNHQAFNGLIDIDTSMPVLVKPIMEHEYVPI